MGTIQTLCYDGSSLLVGGMQSNCAGAQGSGATGEVLQSMLVLLCYAVCVVFVCKGFLPTHSCLGRYLFPPRSLMFSLLTGYELALLRRLTSHLPFDRLLPPCSSPYTLTKGNFQVILGGRGLPHATRPCTGNQARYSAPVDPKAGMAIGIVAASHCQRLRRDRAFRSTTRRPL